MNKKILTLKEARKKFTAHTITLVSGSFEPLDEYYFRFLYWASRQNRPLVVIVQKDEMVLMRRGFIPFITTHKTRAEIISFLEFVDCVIIDNKTAHDPEVIEKLKPKVILFHHDNLNYRKIITAAIKRLDAGIVIKIAPFGHGNFLIKKKEKLVIKTPPNKISKRLISLAVQSKGKISKISAILINNKGQTLIEASNSAKEEHAEIILLNKAKFKKINFQHCCLYILIPPCLMCAEKIKKCGIKKVFYLLSYGDGEGIRYLKKNNIQVKKYIVN